MPHVVHVLTVADSLIFLDGQPAYLREQGYRVSVVCSPGDGLESWARREGADGYAVEMPRRISPLQDLRSLAKLTALLRALRADVVHAHTPKGGLLGMMAATAAGVGARVYSMHGLPLLTARGTKRAILTATERTSCTLAHRVLCMSRSLRRAAVSSGAASEAKLEVLGSGSCNGVDALGRYNPERVGAAARREVREGLGIADSDRVFGFVGRLVRDKGVAELAEAWGAIHQRFPDAHLLVAGVYEPRDPVPEAVRQRLEGLPRVHMLGFRTDLERLYSAIDLLVLPSYREGFPLVPLEASAMGLPVLSTRVPGCLDAVVDGVTGTLVEAGDSVALAAALAAYLDDSALRRRHGLAGQERVRRDFQPQAIHSAVERMYRSLLR